MSPMVGWGKKLDGRREQGSVGQFGTAYSLIALSNLSGLDVLSSGRAAQSVADARRTLAVEISAGPASKAYRERHSLDIPRVAQSLEAAMAAMITTSGVDTARRRLIEAARRSDRQNEIVGWPPYPDGDNPGRDQRSDDRPPPHPVSTYLSLIALRRDPSLHLGEPGSDDPTVDQAALDWVTNQAIRLCEAGHLGLSALLITSLSLLRVPTSDHVVKVGTQWLAAIDSADTWKGAETHAYPRPTSLGEHLFGTSTERGGYEIDQQAAILVALPLIGAAVAGSARANSRFRRDPLKRFTDRASDAAREIVANPEAWVRGFDHQTSSCAQVSYLIKQLERSFSYRTFWSSLVST